ncbi:MAG: hypothetical protein BECKG1743F_GA0114225_100721, partial [Candidatus Kentron sp. G]
FAPVVTQGRNSGATAVDCEFPNSFLGKSLRYKVIAGKEYTGLRDPGLRDPGLSGQFI